MESSYSRISTTERGMREVRSIVSVRLPPIWEIGTELSALPTVNLDATFYGQCTAFRLAVSWDHPSVIERVFLPHQDRISMLITYMHENEIIGSVLHINMPDWTAPLIPLLPSFRNIDINIMHPRNGSPLQCYTTRIFIVRGTRVIWMRYGYTVRFTTTSG